MTERRTALRSGPGPAARAVWLWVLLCAAAAAAQPPPVPVPLQAVVFKKILPYDKALGGRAWKLLVVFGPSTEGEVDEILLAFRRVGIPASSVPAHQFPAALDATVVYVLPGALTPVVQQARVRNRALTISGEPTLAEDGSVSIALARRPDGRAQIVISQGRARAQSQEFSAELLRLSRLVP